MIYYSRFSKFQATQKRLEAWINIFLGHCGEKKLMMETILSYNYATTKMKETWCFINFTILQGQIYWVVHSIRCPLIVQIIIYFCFQHNDIRQNISQRDKWPEHPFYLVLDTNPPLQISYINISNYELNNIMTLM